MTETIVFGGGCFWCVEAVFKRLRGVVLVLPGYAGGIKNNPTYFAVSSGISDHAEVIKVEFDPTQIQLEDLLAVFFSSHDPTSLNRQGNDVGEQYRSAVYYTSESQKDFVQKYIQKLEDEKIFSSTIVTELRPLDMFYEAENYHKNYYDQNRDQPYCQFVIDPKIAKLRKQFSHLLKDS